MRECSFVRNDVKAKDNEDEEYSVDEYRKRRKEKDRERKRFVDIEYFKKFSNLFKLFI